MAEVEKERGEQGSKVKQSEMGVMAEDEEEKAEAGEVEKGRFKCSDCEKDYAFLHKLLHHKTRNCKKKGGGGRCQEVIKLKCVLPGE